MVEYDEGSLLILPCEEVAYAYPGDISNPLDTNRMHSVQY